MALNFKTLSLNPNYLKLTQHFLLNTQYSLFFLEKSLELKEKHVLICKTIFNLAHCVQILDFNSWVLILETFQKIYHMLLYSNQHTTKMNEEFNIDVIIKNLENNLRKYYPDNEDCNKSVLKEKPLDDLEEREIIPRGLETGKDDCAPDGVIEPAPETIIQMTQETQKKRGIFSSLKSKLA